MIRPQVLQQAALLVHFDGVWRDRVLAHGVLGLSDDERTLLAAVDARAFRADDERVARAVAGLVEEFPVAAATAGLPPLFALFRSDAFVDVVCGRLLLVEAAAVALGAPASIPARIELALAQARRKHTRHRPHNAWCAAAGVGVVDVPAGSLAAFSAARSELGVSPRESLAAGKRLTWSIAASADVETVLITGGASLALCAEALGRLLEFAATPRDGASLRARACELGCDSDDEAQGLIDDLVADGLLQAPAEAPL